MNRQIAVLSAAFLAFGAGAALAQQSPDSGAQETQAQTQAQSRILGAAPGDARERTRGFRRAGVRGFGGDLALLRLADQDRDGAVTREEVTALLAEVFDWRDRNGDGVLDEADRDPLARRAASLRAERVAARTDDPWAAPRRAERGQRAAVTRADFLARADALFERLDADGDGRITAEEARQGREARFARADRSGGPGARR